MFIKKNNESFIIIHEFKIDAESNVYIMSIFHGLKSKWFAVNLQGVPKNMGIQWRIRYRLFK